MDEIRVKYSADMAGYTSSLKENTAEIIKNDNAQKDANKSAQEGALKSADHVKTYRQQIKEAQVDYIRLAKAQGESSAETVKAAEKVGELKGQMLEFQRLTDGFNPHKKFIALKDAIELGARAYQGIIGLQALMGNESKELEKTLLKVQAAMSVSDSLTSLLNAKAELSNLAKVVKTEVVGAFATLKNALITSGIGALLIGLGIVIANWKEISQAIGIAAINEEKLEGIEKDLIEQNKKYNEELEKRLLNLQKIRVATLADGKLKDIAALRAKTAEEIKTEEDKNKKIFEDGRKNLVRLDELKKQLKTVELNEINNMVTENSKAEKFRINKDIKETEELYQKQVEDYKIGLESMAAIKEAEAQGLQNIQDKYNKIDTEKAKKKTDELIKEANRLADIKFKNYLDRRERDEKETHEVIEQEYKRITNQWDAEKKLTEQSNHAADEKFKLYLEQKAAEKEAEKKSFEYKIKTATDVASAIGSIDASMLTIAGKNNTAYANFSKALGLAQIAIHEGVAIATAIETATPGDPYTVALRVGAAVAAVVAGMVAAFSSVNSSNVPDSQKYESPKFGNSTQKYKDGVVNLKGPGTWYSDSIPAWLSAGESVITGKGTLAKEDELRALNDSIMDYEDLIYRKYTKPAVDAEKRKAASFAENVAASINLFDDSRIVSELKKNRPATSADIKDLSKTIEKGMNKNSFLKNNTLSR